LLDPHSIELFHFLVLVWSRKTSKMFSKLALLTVVIPFVSALTINAPSTQCASGGQCTITWTTSAGDPGTFTLELLNTVFHNSFAIGNNLVPSAGSATIELPIVPAGDGYTLEAVQIGDINTVYSTSGSFSISPQSSSTSVTSTSSSSSSGAKSGASSSAISAATPASTSAFGVTTTAPASSVTPAGTSTSTGTGTAAAGAATSSSANFNAASSLYFGFNTGSIAVLLLSAVAGAAIVAL